MCIIYYIKIQTLQNVIHLMFNKCTLSNLCRYIFSNGLDYFTFINNIVLVVCHNVVCRYIIGAATPYSALIITIIQLQFSHLLSNLPS